MTLLAEITGQFLTTHPLESARTLEAMPEDAMTAALAAADPVTTAPALRHLTLINLVRVLTSMREDRAKSLFAALPLDTQLVVLHHLDESQRAAFMDAMDANQARMAKRLLRYPEGSAATMMDPWSFTVTDDMSTGQAMELAVRHANHVRFYVYVVDRNHRLAGVLTLRELMQSNRQSTIASLMRRDVTRISATASRNEVLSHPQWQSFHGMPVVDDDGVFLGVIRYETWRRESAKGADPATNPAWQTLFALGELYWVGLTEAMLGAGTAAPHNVKENQYGH